MLAPQDVSVYLNNALRASHQQAELDFEAALPESIHDMPEVVSGRFVALDSTATQEIAAAWKKVIVLNRTQVLGNNILDIPSTGGLRLGKRDRPRSLFFRFESDNKPDNSHTCVAI